MSSSEHPCYRPRRDGERRRKSVRGCIVGADLAVLNLVIVKQGEGELPGLTDKQLPQRLGPKRASKIRKLFNLEKEDDVRKFVVRRVIPGKDGKKPHSRAPKIQRLVTPVVLQRKRRRQALKVKWARKSREEAADYARLLAQRRQAEKEKRQALISQKRSSMKHSRKSEKASEKKSEKTAAKPAETKPAAQPKAAEKKAAAPAKAAAQPKAAAKPKVAEKKAAAPAKPAAQPKAAEKKVAAAKPAQKAAAPAKKATAPKKTIKKAGQK